MVYFTPEENGKDFSIDATGRQPFKIKMYYVFNTVHITVTQKMNFFHLS